ncbi:nitrate/nitrite transporter [Pseudonocardia sp. N23]|uniref:MFS transporter n=1 Tax=Pseudonocardia sp. N23 TaxID=1987376 RepID=UPI000BFD94FC|nr:MFS transporter [Pseudonocardia sp. N23]GAY08315.1 nitrate/nitrite transporter [Pseudonocardia sp. N23]
MRRTGSPRAVVAVSTVAVGLGTAPAFLFGFLGPVLQADLGLSRTRIGLLVGLMFGLTGIGCLLAGRVTERIGARFTVVASTVLLLVALCVPVLAPSYPALVVCALVSGVAYALANVGTNVSVTAALPVARHAVGLAVKTAGVPAAVAVTSFVVPGLGAAYGWRPVLLWSIPVVVVVGIAAALVLPDAKGRARGLSDDPVAAAQGRLPTGFWRFTLAATLLIGGSQAIYSWAVPFLHEGAGATLPVAGVLTAVASLVALAPMIGAARLADRLGTSRRLPMAAALCALLAVAELVLATGRGLAAAAVALVIATGAQLGAVSLMHASVVAAAPHAVGRGSGAAMAGFYLGALFAAPLFGLLVDLTGGYPVAWLIGAALTAASALCFLWCRSVGRTALTTGPASPPTARPAH